MTKQKPQITEEVQADFISHVIDDFYVFYEDGKARVSNVGIDLTGYSLDIKHQGDIYKMLHTDGKPRYFLLMNQTCDLSPGNGKKTEKIKRYVCIELLPLDWLRDNQKGEFEKVIDAMLPNVADGKGTINFDINRNDCFVIPANSLTEKAFIIYFSNIHSFNKEEFDTGIKEEKITKQVTVYSPFIENISSKFGFYFSRVAIDEFGFSTKLKKEIGFTAEIKKQP